ncbi:NADH-cytochrome b5 reductase 1 [Jimgerdemannia flammicorona]|uniref:NADH-cytochrome b5 reductase n=1 Tax=Jimgerdemannia flammicorona TaxID=994334 RepID=A0A433Q1Q0_9FUNG|nr:NADH-cytochrome b5 reductase 1 [Jimgerdemannia flammicorona]
MQRVLAWVPPLHPSRLIHHRVLSTTASTLASSKPHSTVLFYTGLTALCLSAGYYYDRRLAPGKRGDVLDPSRYALLTLTQITPLTHNTSLFRFQLAKPPPEFPVTSSVHVKDDTMQIMRPYTPVNDPAEDGYVDLVVKKYETGTMSRFLHAKKVGEKVEVRGPVREFEYKENMVEEIGLIAGGTGITPLYQLLRHILRTPTDRTRASLLYANRTEPDILLRQELDTLQRQHPDRFRIYYTVEAATQAWTGGKGLVTREMVEQCMPKPGREGRILVAVCGPDG